MTYEVRKGLETDSEKHWLMVEGIRLFPDLDKSTQGLIVRKVEEGSGCPWDAKIIRALDGCGGDEAEDVCYWTGSYLTVTQN